MGINFGGVLVWSLVVLLVVVLVVVAEVVEEMIVGVEGIGGAMPMQKNSIPNNNKKKMTTIEQETLI